MIKKIREFIAGSKRPAQGSIDFGSLNGLQPISRVFGSDRGFAICHYYINQFLRAHAPDVKGHVMEIGDDTYTRAIGGSSVTKSDVLHIREGYPKVSIVADLTCADQIASDTFDCIICTQTLQCIFDVRSAAKTLYRILKPGGVLLATFSGISQISRYDMDRWGEYWRFTTDSAQKLLGEYWPPDNISVIAYGNVKVAISYLEGLSSDDLSKDEMEFKDLDYQVLIGTRAEKPFYKG